MKPASRLRLRGGYTLVEVLLASGIMLLVLGLLWAGINLVLRGAGKAEWKTHAERQFEAFSHVLRQELGRANHLIAVEPGSERIHEPLFAAVWIHPGGEGVSFRVFQSDQEVKNPATARVQSLVQDQVHFFAREGNLVYARQGELEPPETKVLLENVSEVNFSAGSSYEDMGVLGGLLQVRVRMQQPGGALSMARELGVRLGVPVVVVGFSPEGVDLVPPPELVGPSE